MMDVPDKGPVRFLEKQIIKYDRENNLAIMATQTPNTCKWTENAGIDKELLNELWEIPLITDKQNLASLNSALELIWVMLENKCSSIDKDIPPLRAPFVTQVNQIHGYMYYLHVNNNIYTHFALKDTTKLLGKLGNY
jgi:hypothetical protein